MEYSYQLQRILHTYIMGHGACVCGVGGGGGGDCLCTHVHHMHIPCYSSSLTNGWIKM